MNRETKLIKKIISAGIDKKNVKSGELGWPTEEKSDLILTL